MSSSEFLLPDVGEGLTEAEIVAWKVKAGDTVEINQVLVEIETAKSIVELPSPFAGTVAAVLVEEGQTVDVGTAIISVTTDGAPDDAAPASLGSAAPGPGAQIIADTADSIAHESAAAEEQPGAVLVGYGIKGSVPSRRRQREGAGPAANDAPPAAAAQTASRAPMVPAASAGPVVAKPPIRKLAKDLGVDLTLVNPTGLAGEITREDVVREASQASVFRNIQTPAWGEEREEYIPVKGVRKAIASSMAKSAFSAPHVGLFVDVDATRTMEFVKRLKASPDFAGVKVSPMLIMAKAMIWAVRRNPTVNSTWTDEQIIVHHYVNFGFAAATPRGLVVPNIKDAQELSLRELAQAIENMTNVARDGKLQPADMANGTITVTNIGVFGMDTGTPILNPGEVAIVALGTIKQKPWVVDGEVRPRFVTTLGASFDHRVVDGDVASRFLADVASVIEEPALLLD
ncbi:dihydrolipoamide acetyltransferase family protein [Salinibacterium hongtaonis]|uniref:Dihydrolipoamide acetyltransferase component of pyruvate dehydrogenase complex n=1 Tax=Homoserinimonas hongtaonis TaxID=2079791 RepID=A0A2U1T1W4_9MICO|nr:dihydrolipoamide acetyltransferase family protein [Salinibacterium hongtaonis]AWB90414.1 branched-chain alpha-keto acid dehydrogenase subunit E2 [Salinibacterium hongtaonis]PWB97855.1 2-oxo acid dehydrogenase subunit E2 [Salinibacterium hongtaonis]